MIFGMQNKKVKPKLSRQYDTQVLDLEEKNMAIDKLLHAKPNSEAITEKKVELPKTYALPKDESSLMLPASTFLTFAQLVDKWKCDKEYLHHLIFSGKIIPAISLSESQRYPQGVFFNEVPDPDEGLTFGQHQTYDEYYNLHPDDPFYLDKIGDIPKYAKVVHCHFPEPHPTDLRPNNYVFSFFNELAEQCGQFGPCKHFKKCEAPKWFYVKGENLVSNKEEGERLFRFNNDEIDYIEKKVMNSASDGQAKSTFKENQNEESDIDNEGIVIDDVIKAFGSLTKYGENNYILENALNRKPSWIRPAIKSNGAQGRGAKSYWHPVKLALAMQEHYNIDRRHFTTAFQTEPILDKFLQSWKDTFEG